MTYKKRYYVVWQSRESKRYLMHPALRLARRMRRLGHFVRVQIGE
jgi:hypothetical protein